MKPVEKVLSDSKIAKGGRHDVLLVGGVVQLLSRKLLEEFSMSTVRICANMVN